MAESLVSALISLPDESSQYLLWKMFMHDKTKALVLWLEAGFRVDIMPLEMIFYGYLIGVFSVDTVLSRKTCFHDPLLFLPEKAVAHQNRSLLELCNDADTVKAIQIIRSNVHLDGQSILADEIRDLRALSQVLRTRAAILTDDQTWLDSIAAEESFDFSTQYLALAAQYASIECFRFLSINGCVYSDGVMESALYGGNEEIIQMCLEHECSVNHGSLEHSILGHQNKVVDWLISVYNIEITPVDAITAFSCGNWHFFVNHYDRVHEVKSLRLYVRISPDIPRHIEMKQFVQMLMDDLPPEKVTQLKSDVRTILYCDDIELARACQIDISANRNVEFIAKNKCHCLIGEITHKICNRALAHTVNSCDLDATRFLLEHGADPNITDHKLPLLLQTSLQGQLDMVMALVEHGAEVNILPPDRLTALTVAVLSRHEDVAAYLLEHGADPNLGPQALDPILISAAKGDNEQFLVDLVEHGADVDVVDLDGITPLALAVKKGWLNGVVALVKHGADINSQGTPLLMAVSQGQDDIVRYLVEHGADVSAADMEGRSVIHLANGNDSIIAFLIQHGADVNALGRENNTALRGDCRTRQGSDLPG